MWQAGKAPEKLKQQPASFDAAGLVVTQHEAFSTDGMRIPYFQVARKDLPLNGSHPVLLYGYGGFRQIELPSYNATTASSGWSAGGVYVIANIRGGGELGPDWHKAGHARGSAAWL